MDRIAITANPLRPPRAGFLSRLGDELAARGAHVCFDGDAGRHAGGRWGRGAASIGELEAWAGLLVVVGGDGSVLRAVHCYRSARCAFLGVNSGRLGFLTFSAATDPGETAERIVERRFKVCERRLLAAVVRRRRDGKVLRVEALNEITVSRRNVARMIHVEALREGDVINRYHADGLIVSSPTGSTAYSLAAGGPIVAPEARVLLVTPICPHALNVRGLVVPDDAPIELRVLGPAEDEPVMLTHDGEDPLTLDEGDVVQIARAERTVRLAMPEDYSFYGRMQDKLRWQASHV